MWQTVYIPCLQATNSAGICEYQQHWESSWPVPVAAASGAPVLHATPATGCVPARFSSMCCLSFSNLEARARCPSAPGGSPRACRPTRHTMANGEQAVADLRCESGCKGYARHTQICAAVGLVQGHKVGISCCCDATPRSFISARHCRDSLKLGMMPSRTISQEHLESQNPKERGWFLSCCLAFFLQREREREAA